VGLPVDGGWTGVAHDAAQNAFDRGFKTAAHMSDVCTAVSSALTTAYHAVSRAKTDLLDTVHRVEASGDFTVDEQWVVELAAEAWTAEEIDEARDAQRAAQTEINERVSALAGADNPQTLLGAVAKLGVSVDRDPSGLPLPGSIPPADEAPDPSGAGAVSALLQQDIIRRQWEASTPRKVREEYIPERDGFRARHEKTLVMQDGSSQKISNIDLLKTTGVEDANSTRYDWVTVETYDPAGGYVSTVESYTSQGGAKYTLTTFANGSTIVFTQYPNGNKTARIDVGGYSRDIPTDDKLWQHPVSDLTGGALTGLEKGIGKAEDIPYVSSATASKVEVGSRYAGPAVGIATSLVDVYRAPTLEDKCVAVASGTGGFIGGEAGGQLGGLLTGLATKNPAWIGAGAGVVSVPGGWIGSYLGTQLGDLVCR
jgi:hypothetical protein